MLFNTLQARSFAVGKRTGVSWRAIVSWCTPTIHNEPPNKHFVSPRHVYTVHARRQRRRHTKELCVTYSIAPMRAWKSVIIMFTVALERCEPRQSNVTVRANGGRAWIHRPLLCLLTPSRNVFAVIKYVTNSKRHVELAQKDAHNDYVGRAYCIQI